MLTFSPFFLIPMAKGCVLSRLKFCEGLGSLTPVYGFRRLCISGYDCILSQTSSSQHDHVALYLCTTLLLLLLLLLSV